MAIRIDTVDTDGFSMQYFRFGTGERTMVILPGVSVQSVMRSADAVAEAYACFADDFTVFVFDRRTELPPVYLVEEMARDTAAAMETLGLRDVCLFGASQGGMMAMLIAAERPSMVRRLALGSAPLRMGPDRWAVLESWVRMAEAGDGTALFLDFGEKLYPPEVFAHYRGALTAAGQDVTAEELARFAVIAAGARNFDAADRLEEIRCPVLALVSLDDAVLGPDAGTELAARLGDREDFTLYTYKGYGHAAFDTAPDYKARLFDFFTR